MAINKRDSRTININDEIFRWTISPDSGYLVFVAEHETIKGQRLQVYIESDIDSCWVNIPYVETMNQRLIKPGAVRKMIIEAIRLGWKYKEPGKPIVFDLKNELIYRR